jgi:hypothetical protein
MASPLLWKSDQHRSSCHQRNPDTTRTWDDKDSGKKNDRTEIVLGDISLLSDGGRLGESHVESTVVT